MRRLAAVLLAALPCGVAGAQENRLWWAEVELAGPLSALRVDAGAEGETRVALELRQGESRRLAVPVPVRSPLGAGALSTRAVPELVASGAGRATWRRWLDAQPDAQRARVPAGLLARPLPPAPGSAPRSLGGGEAALLLGTALLVVAARRRAFLVLLVGLLGAGAGYVVARGPSSGAEGTLRLLDLDRDARTALESEAGRELALRLEPGAAVWLEAVPADARLELEVEPAPPGVAGWVRVSEPGARLVLRRPRATETWERASAPRGLVVAWTRTPDGAWSAHGAWPRGAPLPPARAGAPAPPGWLAAGLPPGRGVLLGREEGGRWVRGTGF